MMTPLASRLRRWSSPLLAVAAAAALVASARAEAPGSILHEFIPPDPGEDVSFAATTLEGDLPAAIQTPSGLATAPDPRKSPAADHVYGGATTDDGPDSTYEPDRDTRRPNVENYDDPFSPATAPFKRLRAYDWVDADYSLRVRDKSLRAIPVGGTVGAGDEPFYGDMSVDLIPGQPVRIPTVGPGARVLRMHANPEVPVEILHDGADNWFVRGKDRQRVRLVVELAIPRDTFGRDFTDVDWGVLDAVETSRNGAGASGASGAKLHDAAFREVAQAIGISRAMRPREVVRKMVEYYRGFAPSEEPPSGRQDIYLDLALSKKGVCRHRAFGFLVTALGIGVPARMVVNEAHAWVEVYDSKLWHRIDLGGAAANLDNEPDPSRPAYLPPPDPYAWPAGRDSGQELAERNRNQANNGNASGPQNGSAQTAGDGGAPMPSPTGSPAAEPTNKLPDSDVTVGAIDGDVRRGLPLHLQGSVTTAGAPCPHLRVDVLLVGHVERRGRAAPAAPAPGTPIGSLSTDERGHYDGAVVVPRDLSLGDYELVVQTQGDARCGAGRTK
ncbi:MAG: transglutaminase domain-containing protein [Minicystis sp.]